MDVAEALQRRFSVRHFKPDPVPAEVVRGLLVGAGQAPSNGNLQPWRAYVLAGEPLAALKAAMAAHTGEETPEFRSYPDDLWDPYHSRRRQTGEELYAAIGVPREDKAGRRAQFARNGQFFGAPVGIFFVLETRHGPPQWEDLGILLQSFMLLAVEAGLATCAQGFWARYPVTVRQALNLPEDQLVCCGMALGYAADHPINAWRTGRAAPEDWIAMRGF